MNRNIHDSQRLITFVDLSGSFEEISTTEPSTSTASLRTAVQSVGPLRQVASKEKSNRGRKPMKSAVLTSPEEVAVLREQAKKRTASAEKKVKSPQKKVAKPSTLTLKKKSKKCETSSSSCDVDFCIICMKDLPHQLTKKNSIECNVCKRPVHFTCAELQYGIFICINCNSEYSEEEEEV